MKKFITLILIIFASKAGAVTWNETLSLVQKNSNELKSAQKALESYEWSYKKAYSAFLPQVSASASKTDTQTGTSSATSYSYGISATQTLFKGFANLADLQSAYNNLEYYRASYKDSLAGIIYDARSAYAELSAAQENIKLLQQIYNQRRENSRLIELRYESGREDKGNLMRTRADEAQAKNDLSAAKRNLELAGLKLTQLIGADSGSLESLSLNESIPSPDYKIFLKSSPAYLMAKYKLESAEIAHRSTLSEFLPTVSLSGSYRKSGSDWPPDAKSTSVSLSLSYSLFPGGSNFADRIIYGIKLEQAREDFMQSEKDSLYNLESAFNSYKSAVEALSVGKLYLAATKERSKIARSKYLNGLILYDEWDRIENEYISSQKQLVNYQKSAHLAEAQWHKSYGGWIR